MAQPTSRYDTKASGLLAAQPTNIKETSTVGPSSTTASGSSQQDVYETTTQFNPLAQQSLDALIRMLLQGNAPGYSTGQRESVMPLLQNLLQDYSKQNAFGDAQGLMALTLQKAMEQNMPAISRAIEELELLLVVCKHSWLEMLLGMLLLQLLLWEPNKLNLMEISVLI